ncbi:hypothetical protein J7E38_13545 [Bacillus sp. ISL-35]|uniref:hypothetical protein n=1 Tax=Bacillus sp. ISL-35 TaxID=2819122 RepID=UPI001BEC199F|nr:hypothetical protein [Bacillus sp. ISL-35]MBT2680033.1 hypothetical protein [Bacillus sp. ISL-35]MBT2702990.1 hypothetical protein [Chryseobacterium sp. ISL-80]
MRTLKQIDSVHQKILSSDFSSRVKSMKSQSLLNELIRTFEIPKSISVSYEKEHPEVVKLYHKITKSIDA